MAAGRELLAGVDVTPGVRLLGVSVSQPRAAGRATSSSFDELGRRRTAEGWDEASRAVDEIRSRFGAEVIGPAALVGRAGSAAHPPWPAAVGP